MSVYISPRSSILCCAFCLCIHVHSISTATKLQASIMTVMECIVIDLCMHVHVVFYILVQIFLFYNAIHTVHLDQERSLIIIIKELYSVAPCTLLKVNLKSPSL